MEIDSVRTERIIIIIGTCAIGLISLFGLAWVVFGDAKTAATVLIVGIGILGSFAAGMGAQYFGTNKTIEHIADAFKYRPAESQPIIDVSPRPRLQSNDLVSVDSQMMVRQEQIERAAVAVYRTMYPLRQPTRTNIQTQFPELKSNGFVAAVQEYLKAHNLAVGGGQGRDYQWNPEGVYRPDARQDYSPAEYR